MTQRRRVWPVVWGAYSCGGVQVVTTPLFGLPWISWRLPLCLVAGGAIGLLCSRAADWWRETQRRRTTEREKTWRAREERSG